MCTGKAELLPGNASGPVRWRWLWVPSPPLGWYLGLHSPPQAEPETAQMETYTHGEDRLTDRQTDGHPNKHIKHGVRVTRQSKRQKAVMQEFGKEDSETMKRQKNADKHTNRWTYPVKVHKDGEGGCIFMSEWVGKRRRNKQRSRRRENDNNMLSGCIITTPHGSACSGGLLLWRFYQHKICSQGRSVSPLGEADIKGTRIRTALHTQTLQLFSACRPFLTDSILSTAGITAQANNRDVRLTDAGFHLTWQAGEGTAGATVKTTSSKLWRLKCQQWAYLPEPAIPDLFQVEETVAAEICGFQELDWKKRRESKRCNCDGKSSTIGVLMMLCLMLDDSSLFHEAHHISTWPLIIWY